MNTDTPEEKSQPADEPQYQEVAASFAERVQDQLAEKVDALYLFGSVARNETTSDSDVDLLAVVADEADYGRCEAKTSPFTVVAEVPERWISPVGSYDEYGRYCRGTAGLPCRRIVAVSVPGLRSEA
ncbi:MAG: nucleotidyltransferase domain-containing protein [Halosimplex sp.]